MGSVETIDLMGMSIAKIDRWSLLDEIFTALQRGRGLWVLTANLDFLRRHASDPQVRSLYERGDIRVADGMPLVWASWLQGTPLPERVAGSSLVWLIAERAAAEGRTIFLLGGTEESLDRCTAELKARNPKIEFCGRASPWLSERPSDEELGPVIEALEAADPDIVLVGLGSPKQEFVIDRLRRRFPRACMIGVGISFSFVAGLVRRAPPLMRRWGLEWLHRMVQEPNRLARRYLVDGLPFAAKMLASTACRRLLPRRAAVASAPPGRRSMLGPL